jgi:hypothetical protein
VLKVELVAVLTGETTPLNLTTFSEAAELKLEPVIVTGVPTIPDVGLKAFI